MRDAVGFVPAALRGRVVAALFPDGEPEPTPESTPGPTPEPTPEDPDGTDADGA